MAQPDIRVLIDQFLKAEKTLVGVSDWQLDHNGALRWRVNVAVGGEVRQGFALEVKTYPELGPEKFRMILMAEKAVWRLDCAGDPPHNNPLSVGADIPSIIIGPHYHAWADNRRYATPKALPHELHIARIFEVLPYQSAFRWFCSKTGISGVASLDLPDIPRRVRLI